MMKMNNNKRRRVYKIISVLLLLMVLTTSTMTLEPKQQVISYNGYVYDAELIKTVVEDDIIFNSMNTYEQLDAIELYIYTIGDMLKELQSNQSQP